MIRSATHQRGRPKHDAKSDLGAAPVCDRFRPPKRLYCHSGREQKGNDSTALGAFFPDNRTYLSAASESVAENKILRVYTKRSRECQIVRLRLH